MYVLFVVQAVLTALHAAVAQDPFFQLVCPDLGFKESEINTVQCTVRGQDVANAMCVSAVTLVKLEKTVNAVGSNPIGHSIYPTCETNWSHSGNNNGRCVTKEANDIYTYEFNVTGNRAILTTDTGLRCYADCTTGPGSPNPFTFNSSESCGPPVKFAEVPESNEGLSTEEEAGIGGGAAVVAIGCGSGVIVFVIKKTKIYVYLFFPPDQDGLKNYEILQKEIEKMWGVGIGKITPKDKEKYKNADYVIDISKLSGDQKQKLTELKALIVRLGGQLNCDELQAIEDAAYEPAADYPSGSLKPNASSERPSNGRNSVTAM